MTLRVHMQVLPHSHFKVMNLAVYDYSLAAGVLLLLLMLILMKLFQKIVFITITL